MLRRRARAVALAWVLCNVTTITLLPSILWAYGAEELLECTCAHDAHTTCPMHHKRAGGSSVCSIRGTDPGVISVLQVLSNAGLVPASAQPYVPQRPQKPAHPHCVLAGLRVAPPDPPPPRTFRLSL
jgi:hypothetical protein